MSEADFVPVSAQEEHSGGGDQENETKPLFGCFRKKLVKLRENGDHLTSM